MKIEIELLVSDVSIEQRSFVDRVSGQSREYTSCRLSGITSDMTTPCIIRVPEQSRPALEHVHRGDTIHVLMRSLDLSKGILDGVSAAILDKEGNAL